MRPLLRLGIHAAVVVLTVAGATQLMAAREGDYTDRQASAGEQVYRTHCANCHGSRLQGGAGPALAGSAFASNLSYSKMSAKQLFDFVRTQMPANAPGSLSEQQYLEALAYILSKNGYPAGPTPLTQSTIDQVQLLPYPAGKNDKQSLLVGSPSL